jgi:protease I
MADRLTGMPVAFLIANEGAERIELSEPWQAVDQEGALPSLVSLKPGHATLFDHLDRADAWPVDLVVDEVRATDFGGLVLPGGVANPDRLRMDRRAVALVRSFVDSGRPVAVICHGAWTLVEADVLRGRTITSYPSLRTDIINAGGIWEDRDVIVDRHGPNVIISSRGPRDLPVWCQTLVDEFSQQLAGTR